VLTRGGEDTIGAGKGTVTINLDGTPQTVYADLWRLWLTPTEPEPGVQIQPCVDPAAGG